MARKRMIDPDFWTDEKIVQLPFEARLLFIGLWNVSDDSGLLWDEPERIRLLVLPNDPVDIDDLLDLLVATGLIDRNVTEAGRGFISIPHFLEHQKISHPAESRIPTAGSRKIAIPPAVRRAVATKYGCSVGESCEAACYYCGMVGRIHWHRLYSGKPSAWVSFSGLELDHFEAESRGGKTTPDNIVLACRECNRSKNAGESIPFLIANSGTSANTPEDSGTLTPSLIESKRRESKGSETKTTRDAREVGADAPAVVDAPHAIVVAFLDRLGKTVADVAPAWVDEQRRHAKWLIDQGFAWKTISLHMSYLDTQKWRDKPVASLGTICKTIPEWEALDKPAADKPRGSPNGAKPSNVELGFQALEQVGDVLRRHTG